MIRSLLAVLEARDVKLNTTQREVVYICRDNDLLLRWTTRAVTAATIEEVFAED